MLTISQLLILALRMVAEVTEERLGTLAVMHKIPILIIFIRDLALIVIK